MRDAAQVLEVKQNGSVLVIPFITNACISCTNSGCGKRGSPFTAANPNGLPLAPGMTVRISAKKRYQALQALTALCVPLVCAAAGWFVSAKLAVFAGMRVHEWVHALGVLAGIFIPSVIIALISRFKKPVHGEISEIVA